MRVMPIILVTIQMAMIEMQMPTETTPKLTQTRENTGSNLVEKDGTTS
jgi:hypothetical protein